MEKQNFTSDRQNKIVRLLDGMHYTFMLLDYNQKLLYDACLLIKKNKLNLISALSHCWQIIDMTHRIREMSQAIPTLNQDDRHVRKFLSNTKLAENFRHYVQHFRNELLESKYGKFPVFGSLSWIDNEDNMRCHVAIIGSQLNGIKHSGLVYDRQNNRFISRVSLSRGNESYNFDLMYNATLEFKRFIIDYLDQKSVLQEADEDSITIFTYQIMDKTLSQ